MVARGLSVIGAYHHYKELLLSNRLGDAVPGRVEQGIVASMTQLSLLRATYQEHPSTESSLAYLRLSAYQQCSWVGV
jgi:hypothetical protein